MLIKAATITLLSLSLAACAGRAPQSVATVQPQDVNATCTMITAEIQANNIKVEELASEQGVKVAQNVAAGIVGFAVPVLWFAMDWQGSASKDVAALQARQQFLTSLALERCKATPASKTKRRG